MERKAKGEKRGGESKGEGRKRRSGEERGKAEGEREELRHGC